MLVKGGKYNLLLARVVVVVTAAVICAAFYLSYRTKSETYYSLNSQLTTETSRFKTLSDKTLLVAEYEEKFNQYMPIEQYENENRLYWLDSLDKIRIKNKIPKLNYTISVQKPYDYKDGLIKTKGLKIKVSEIKLTMSLMHEADLLSVARDLKNIKTSIHIVNSCNLKRTTAAGKANFNTSKPNIDATCNIKWFTFKVI